MDPSMDQLCINTIRTLSMDAVQQANSGHPGAPMGLAPAAYVLWTRFLRHNPSNPAWPDRDRFVLSAGHGSILLYSMLYLTGYEVPLEQLKQFRQWGSRTPGHPERGMTPGVETTTGPLGQGFGNGVGMAIAEAHLAARDETSRPSLILLRTHIGYGSPGKQDTFEAHGSPLGAEEVKRTKQQLGWPLEPPFFVPEDALAHFRAAIGNGKKVETEWQKRFSSYAEKFPALARELEQVIGGALPAGWEESIPQFSADAKGVATRAASGKVLNAIAAKLPTLIGGSADLNPSTFTVLSKLGDFESPQRTFTDSQGSAGGAWDYSGRNLHFGVREHGMAASLNGMAAHGGIIPFGSTFLIFSDYMRPSIRLAALMELGVIYVFTHDSIGLGEDGPTHQPVEQLAALRAIPQLVVIRPGDANETAVAWRVAIESRACPVALVLTRQNLPTLDRSQFAPANGLRQGAYVLADPPGGKPDIVLIGTGSEVSLVIAAEEKLAGQEIQARVVSMPSWELFDQQPQAYREAVLPRSVRARLAVEAALPQGWHRYVGDGGDVVGVERFGASAPGNVVMEKLGFTVSHVVERATALVGK